VTDQNNKPTLDVETLEKLLEAAYVLQEHNREMQQRGASLELQSEQLRQEELATQAVLQKAHREVGKRAASHGDYTLILAEIVEAQAQIQMRHLDLDPAIALVAERTAKITNANGAGVAILNGKKVCYRASFGNAALPLGTEVPLESAVCAACFRTGQVVRSENFNPEFLFDPEPVRKRGIESLIAVPIYHDGKISGALEVYYERVNGFIEQDIHTCQLMAGLVTEAFARDAEVTWKRSLADERNTMLEALERLKPELAALAQHQAATSGTAGNAALAAAVTVESPVCQKCGDTLAPDEKFCGKCGAPRSSEARDASLQSKLAAAWTAQQKSKPPLAPGAPTNGDSPHVAPTMFDPQTRHPDLAADKLPDDFQLADLDPAALGLPPEDEPGLAKQEKEVLAKSPQQEQAVEETSLVRTQGDVTWTSAAKAKDFLNTLTISRPPSALRRFWTARRGDFYLAIAVLLVAIVLRWGVWSDHSVGASGGGTTSVARHKSADPEDDLSIFDKLLISLGLADAPEPPEYKGNPDTQVWEDLHTALYYCPGSDLYGKTPKGKFTTQRDAQLDQFEPASRKACD
jgi:GAF domain-containing protein